MERNERLKFARERAGFKSAAAAARRLGAPYGTYSGHENGLRGIKDDELAAYAKAFRVPLPWLAYGTGTPDAAASKQVDLVGYVLAGDATVTFADGQGPFDTVDAPDGASANTVAVEIRGASLGPAFDGWLVFYDQEQRAAWDRLSGRLCVCEISDGRVMVKILRPAKTPGLWHLYSNIGGDPILDQEVTWAAPVTFMRARG